MIGNNIVELLQYPFDTATIIKNKRKLKKILKNSDCSSKINIKVAILGGSTTSEIKDILELFLLKNDIEPNFYESDYNRYFEEVMFSDKLRKFNPDIIYIHTNIRNIKNGPSPQDTKYDIDVKLQKEYSLFEDIWMKINEDFNCIIIQNNFELPNTRIYGNSDSAVDIGMTNFIHKLNQKLINYKNNNENFIINDINYLSSSIGLQNWYDNNIWFLYKYAMSFEGIVILSHSLSNIIKSIYGKSKKCLVLDLDNTLWGGVIGDDGIDDINLGRETPIGEAYIDFQLYIEKLYKRGVMLAICSKNDFNVAMEGLSHPDMILSKESFMSMKINWNEKYKNILEISDDLNINIDSMVFIDDNEYERYMITKQLVDVEVPMIGNDITKYIDYIDKNGYFECITLSKEDIYRNDYYKYNKQREDEKRKFIDYNDFLSSLDMFAEIDFFKSIYLDRIYQLINKTNQFNLTTKRYKFIDVEKMYNDSKRINLYCRLRDKFGDNGLISVISGRIENECEVHIELWVMSCRVFNRNIEKILFLQFIKLCKDKKINSIFGYYNKSDKNIIVENHYDNLGFNIVYMDDFHKKYKLDIDTFRDETDYYIKLGEY